MSAASVCHPLHPPCDCRLTGLSTPGGCQHGRNPFLYSNVRGSLLLGVYACSATTCAILCVDHWLVSHLERHQILHKPILTVTKVQPSWPSRRHYRHRFLPRKPNLHNCSSHQRVPPFCWENSWHPCRHSPLSLRPKPPQCSFATLRNLRLHHPAESWHILSRHRCLGQGPEASVGTFCLRDISRWHGDW